MSVRKNAATKSPVKKEKTKKILPKTSQSPGKADKPTKSDKAAVKQASAAPAGKKSVVKTEKANSPKKTAVPAVRSSKKTTKTSTQQRKKSPSVTSQGGVSQSEKLKKAGLAGKVQNTKKKTSAKKKVGLSENTEVVANLKTEEPVAVKLLKQLREALDSRKAEDIIILDLREVSGYLDYFLLATALSPLHVRNLANETADIMRSAGYRPLNNISAEIESGWQILDYGEIVVHLFTAEKRAFYNLEKVWEKASKI